MTEILLIRHGETDWNVEKRLQGHVDIALNAEGKRQATALGRVLLDEPLDVIIASDLQRAVQTAQAIAASRGMAVHIEPALRERCYGALEGLRYSDINERYPDAYAAWCARDIDARYPMGRNNAETLREFSQRAIGVIKRLATVHDNKKIAVVTHGGVLECVYRAASGVGLLPRRDFPIFNASINRIMWNATAMQISRWGDVAHLTHIALDEVDK
ncbi:MAG TPA: histidine phosphatase family protein [Burkholderiaceae bacterium]|jgi:probable phosphoglycerate mutase|nr:histidine phosphatase family protein [Burkholderiaceae bacterium]